MIHSLIRCGVLRRIRNRKPDAGRDPRVSGQGEAALAPSPRPKRNHRRPSYLKGAREAAPLFLELLRERRLWAEDLRRRCSAYEPEKPAAKLLQPAAGIITKRPLAFVTNGRLLSNERTGLCAGLFPQRRQSGQAGA